MSASARHLEAELGADEGDNHPRSRDYRVRCDGRQPAPIPVDPYVLDRGPYAAGLLA